MTKAQSSALSDAEKVRLLEQKVASLEQQLDWFKRQVFGRKSEKRRIEDCPQQPLLNGWELPKPAASAGGEERVPGAYALLELGRGRRRLPGEKAS